MDFDILPSIIADLKNQTRAIEEEEAMRGRTLVLAICVPIAVSASGEDLLIAYHADSGVLPSAIGWIPSFSVGLEPSLSGGVLSQTSLPLQGTCTDNPVRTAGWAYNEQIVSIDRGFTVEIDLRVLSSENTACDCGNASRAGFRVWSQAAEGLQVSVGFDSNRVFLSNDHTALCPTIPQMLFNTTDGFHVYRVVVGPGGSVLSIDGEPVLSLPAGGRPHPAMPAIRIGDHTSWSNSNVEIRSITVSQPASCNPADLALPVGLLDLADINAFTSGFLAMEPIADIDTDGVFDLADINAFIAAFTAGCP